MGNQTEKTSASRRAGRAAVYLIFVGILSVLAVLMLASSTVLPLDPGTRAILQYADTAICALLAASMISLLLVLLGSIAILQFEQVPEANIRGPADAVWWAVVTLTTVGYGDRFPVTPEGRFVAAVLMVSGMGLFGTISGSVAAWFLSTGTRTEASEVALLHREIAELRREPSSTDSHGGVISREEDCVFRPKLSAHSDRR